MRKQIQYEVNTPQGIKSRSDSKRKEERKGDFKRKGGNLIIPTVLLILLGISGFSLKNTLSTYIKISKDTQDVERDVQALSENIETAKCQLDNTGKTFLLNNAGIAGQVLQLQGATNTAITAQTVIDGTLTDIVSVASIDDVSYFTESVEYMQFDFDIIDLAGFINSVKESTVIWDYVSIDTVNSKAIVRVAAAKSDVKTYENASEDTTKSATPSDIINQDNTIGGALEQNPATEQGAVADKNSNTGGD